MTMGNTEMEALARALMQSRQGNPKLAKGMEKLGAFTNTEEGQQFLRLLASGGADAVKKAADAALAGDKEGAKTALMSLLSTKEGAVLAAKLIELMGK